MVRAKFRVDEVTRYGNWNGGKVLLRAVTGNGEENKSFWEATPSGQLEMTVKGDALDLLQLGKSYYLDFTPASED